MNGEGINYKVPEGADVRVLQCRAITQRRGLDRRCKHKTQRGIYCHQHLKVQRGLRITESETGEYGEAGELGLFTTRPIKKNGIICEFTGKKVVGKFDNPFGLQIKKRPPTFLDASRTTENGEGRFAQESDDPNAEIVYNGQRAVLKALRSIAAGEEILIDKERYKIPAEKPKPKRAVPPPQNVAAAYAPAPAPVPVPAPVVWVAPPAPKTAVPRPAAAPRPVAVQPRPVAPAPVVPDRKLTVKEKRYRLWILAMQNLYEDEAFAKEKKVKVKRLTIPVPAYDARKSALHNEQTMQAAAWDALKPFSKWLKVRESEAEDIIKDYIKRKRLQLGKGIPKGALIYQGSLQQQHG